MEIFNRLIHSLLITTIILKSSDSANILVFDAVGTHSTRISMLPLMEALNDKGHQITHLSAFENFQDPEKKSKIRHYTPKKWKQIMGDWDDKFNFFEMRKLGTYPQIFWDLQDIGILACEALYSDPEFVNWVKTSQFDLVIIESVVNDCAYGLVHVFKTKAVIYGTTTVLSWFPDAYGLPDESSTLPDLISNTAFGEEMTFWQRLTNAIIPIAFNIKRDYSYFSRLEEITRVGLGLKQGDLPSFREIEKNVSLILLTSHFALDFPRSFPPHVIPIGGAVLGSKKIKPLTQEIEQFINSAGNGFIYVSFGTVTQFTNFDQQIRIEFIKALETFPEMKFLWKSTSKIVEPVPKNVMVTDWVPQQTVLGHSKLKAFITHCGMGGTAEAVNFGVPLILFPVMFDQDLIAKSMEAKGVGIKLEITTLKKHELEYALSEILTNPKYLKNMKRLSESFRDKPIQPVETATWWIEYIMRHENSNDYLLPLNVRQGWMKRRQIDVWITLALGILTFLVIFVTTLVCLLKTIFKSVLVKRNGSKLKYN